MDRLAAMQTFVRVIDRGGFAAAARELNLSPAVVTRQIAELEAHLGVRLINRTTRRLALTDTGARYLDQVRQILAEVQEAEAMAADAVNEPRGLLRVLAPPALAVHQLARLLPRFLARHPQVTLELTVRAVDGPDAEHDVALVIATEPPAAGGFVARPLARWEAVMCAAPSYLSAHGVPLHPTDLAQGHEMLLPVSVPEPNLRRSGPDGEWASVPVPRPLLATDHFDTLYAAALAGLGITPLPSYAAEDALRRGALQRVLPQWCVRSGLLYAALPTRQYLPARTRAWLDFLAETFGDATRDPWLSGIPAIEAVPPQG